MDGEEILKSEFKELIKLTQEERIEEKLQWILSYFLRNFSLKVNDKIVQPIEVEAYYFHANIFEDKYVHCEKGFQDNHFGKLYFHKMNGTLKTGTYKGMDICLSCEEGIFLALLIRSAKIDGKAIYGPSNCVKEIFGTDEIYKEKYEEEQAKDVLVRNAELSEEKISCGERYGLSKSPDNFSGWEEFYKMKLRMFIGDFEGDSSVKIKAKRKLETDEKL